MCIRDRLGIVESREDDELRRERQAASNYKYAKSWLALFLPVIWLYAFFDSYALRSQLAAGTAPEGAALTLVTLTLALRPL